MRRANWKLTSILCAGRKSLGFSVSMEIDLFFARVVEVHLISVWAVELDLVIV